MLTRIRLQRDAEVAVGKPPGWLKKRSDKNYPRVEITLDGTEDAAILHSVVVGMKIEMFQELMKFVGIAGVVASTPAVWWRPQLYMVDRQKTATFHAFGDPPNKKRKKGGTRNTR